MKPDKRESILPINEQIRAPKLQLITENSENIGIVGRTQALVMAKNAGLDLVLITDMGPQGVPIAKIMDYGKALYEKKKRQSEVKKHQKIIQIKEIKFRPKIGEHDYQTKMKQMIDFLIKGKRVKVSLFFRGRENVTRQEKAEELFGKIQGTLEGHGFQEIIHEKDTPGATWSRIYYLKNGK